MPASAPAPASPDAVDPDVAIGEQLIELTPDKLVHDAPVGDEIAQTYTLHKSISGLKIDWTHDSDLGQHDGHGQSSTVRVKPATIGNHYIKTRAKLTGSKGSRTLHAQGVLLVTRTPTTAITSLWSQGPDVSLPIVKNMTLGEELVVHGTLAHVGESVSAASAVFSGGNVNVESVEITSPGLFTARLKPLAAGPLKGELRIVPSGVVADRTHGAQIAIQVDPAGTKSDRPVDVRDACEQIRAEVTFLFERRIDAVHRLIAELGRSDPPVPEASWKSLLKVIGTMALGAATAGIGAIVGKAIMASAAEGLNKVMWQEVGKVLARQSIEKVVTEHVNRLADPGAKTKAPPEGGEPSVKHTLMGWFESIQVSALRDTQQLDSAAVTSEALLTAERLEKMEPGSGYRGAVVMRDVLRDHTHGADRQQYLSSLQAWATVMARASLNDGSDVENPTEVDGSFPAQVTGLGGHAAGVLRLELMMPAPGIDVYTVRAARIGGISNSKVVRNLDDIPLGELRMPITAQYEQSTGEEFIIGKNEAAEYTAYSTGGLLQKRSRGGSDVDAARSIFETDLAMVKVTPSIK